MSSLLHLHAVRPDNDKHFLHLCSALMHQTLDFVQPDF